MTRKQTLVFLPGAWHQAATWDKVISILSPSGQKSVALELPSVDSDPSITLKDDIDAARAAIELEISAGNDVVLVCHSYGGVVGASAIKGFARSNNPLAADDDARSKGHVTGLVLVASFFQPAQKTLIQALGGAPPPWWIADWETGVSILVEDPEVIFYHDLPEPERKFWKGKLKDHSLKPAFEGGEHVYEGWKDVPVMYVGATEDKSLPVDVQRIMVNMAKDAGADVIVRELVSSHSPMLSRPDELSGLLVEALDRWASH